MEGERIAVLITVFVFVLTRANEVNGQEKTNLNVLFNALLNLGRDFYYEEGDTLNGQRRYDCPACDSSVYSYCSDKLLHDACCCLNPYDHRLPRQCRYADCSFLHANSCREHKLITACCCSKFK